ncbi:MAG: hypothetical protein H6715_02465 [Myxococcales bacterium]|nr:hypothetical protein [Myxococcales bacterium]
MCIGNRTVVLRQGSISDVQAADEDVAFEYFVEQSGRLETQRLERVKKQANEYQLSFEATIVQHRDLHAVLGTLWRAMWCERLAHGLRMSWNVDPDSIQFLPYAPKSTLDQRAGLVGLLLDALSHLAANEDADGIGRLLRCPVEWQQGSAADQAQSWAQLDLDDAKTTVLEILEKRPGFAPRLMALAQTGHLTLLPPESPFVEEPEPLPNTLSNTLATKHTTVTIDARRLSSYYEHPKSEAASYGGRSQRLSSMIPGDDLRLRPLSPPSIDYSDPLEDIERRLNHPSLSPQERALLWCQAGNMWKDRFASMTEAFRCYREATAADPGDLAGCEAAIAHADALGEQALALSYAETTLRHAKAETRQQALRNLASYALRARSMDQALTSSEQLLRSPSGETRDFELAARILAEAGTIDHVRAFSDAVSMAAHTWIDTAPERALATYAWAFQLCPISDLIHLEYCALLCDMHREDAVPIVNEWHRQALAGNSGSLPPFETDASAARQIFGKRGALGTLEAERRLDELRALRPLFLDSPPYLSAIADFASQLGRIDLVKDAAETWCDLAPWDSQAAVLRLLATCNMEDQKAITAAAKDLLITAAPCDQLLPPLEVAIRKLVQMSALEPAMALGGHILEHIGLPSLRRAHAHGMVSLLTELGAHHGNRRLLLMLHDQETWNANAHNSELHLLAISDLYREAGDISGEVRALLRRVQARVSDREAFLRLFELYSSAGRTGSIKTLWSSRKQSVTSKQERWRCLLDLAALAYYQERDTASACKYLREISADGDQQGMFVAADALIVIGQPQAAIELLIHTPHASPRTAVECHKKAAAIAEFHLADLDLGRDIIASGILLTWDSSLIPIFERLAIASNDVQQAKSLYDSLAQHAGGRHSRRAIFYRAARFFELAGEVGSAFDSYLSAFEQRPINGVIFRSLVRLAPQQSSNRDVVRAYRLLAQHSHHEEERVWATHKADELAASTPPSVGAREPLTTPPAENRRRSIVTLDQRDPMGPLVERLRRDPTDLDALRSIDHLGAAHAPSLWDVAREILALGAPDTALLPSSGSDAKLDPDSVDRLIHSEADLQTLAVLERVWLGANPRFRHTLSQCGLRESDRLSPLEAPMALSRAYMKANRVLGTPYPLLYSKKNGSDDIKVLPTHPPSIMCGNQLELDEQSLSFRLGAALELARPGPVLMGVLPAIDGEALMDGIVAAFGDVRQRPPRKEAAVIGAELWEIMPKRDQDWIRKQLALLAETPTYDAVRHQVLLSALKAGLIVCDSVTVALRNLQYLGEPLGGIAIRTLEDLKNACQKRPLVKDFLYFTLSDAYLAIRRPTATNNDLDRSTPPLPHSH